MPTTKLTPPRTGLLQRDLTLAVTFPSPGTKQQLSKEQRVPLFLIHQCRVHTSPVAGYDVRRSYHASSNVCSRIITPEQALALRRLLRVSPVQGLLGVVWTFERQAQPDVHVTVGQLAGGELELRAWVVEPTVEAEGAHGLKGASGAAGLAPSEVADELLAACACS